MSDLIYYQNPYLKRLEKVTVIEKREGGAILDKTIFYPECGGQPGDRGFFGSSRIKDTKKAKDGTPVHIIEGEEPEVGEEGTLTLDWDHRFFHMAEHSAQHLISALLFTEYGIGTVAVHQGEEVLTVETDRSNIEDDILLSLEEKAIGRIHEGLSITQVDMTREEAEALHMRRSIKVDDPVVKVVKIENLDAVACGGIHVSSTSEIGELCFLGSETIRGHVRTIWAIGKNAREYRRENERAVKEAGKLLSADASSLSKEIERLQKELMDTRRELKEMKREKAEGEFNSHREENPIIYSTALSLDDIPQIISSSAQDKTVFITEEGGKNGFVFFGTKDIFEKIKASLSLKGGGREPLFRGTLLGDVEEALEKVKEIIELEYTFQMQRTEKTDW